MTTALVYWLGVGVASKSIRDDGAGATTAVLLALIWPAFILFALIVAIIEDWK